MGAFAVFAGALVAVAIAVVSKFAEARASRVADDEILDRDSLRSRIAWVADIAALGATALGAASSLVQQLRLDDSSQLLARSLMAVAAIAFSLCVFSGIAAIRRNFLNRYPESLYQRLSRDHWAGFVSLQWLPPGVQISIILNTFLAIVTLISRN